MSQLDTVTLPDNVYWSDEFQWSPVEQAKDRFLTGALLVEETAKTKGRPITLEGMWVTRSTVEALKALEAQVSMTMTLTLPGGEQHTVLWNRGNTGFGVDATPVNPAAPDVYQSDDLYILKLHLMEA